MTIDEAKNVLENVWDFAMAENEENADTLEKAIDIAIKALELQCVMKKHCESHDCTDCRGNGICAKTFLLDELQ